MQIGSKEWSDLIIDSARTLGIELRPDHTRQFAAHARELMQWNKTFNITSIVDPGEIALKHFVDSLPAAKQISPDATLLDIGSGGGFPGIPLKILIPALTVTLIDASRKKANFLKHVIRCLKLKQIEALHARAENLVSDLQNLQRFDAIISRALSDLPTYIRLAKPLLAPGGIIIALKGQANSSELIDFHTYFDEEGLAIQATARNSGVHVENYNLPFINSQRSIIVLSGIA